MSAEATSGLSSTAIGAEQSAPVEPVEEEKLQAEDVEEHRIYGRDFKLELSYIDHSLGGTPRYGFALKLPQDHPKDNIITIFKDALQRVVYQIPWLAAYVKPSPEATGFFMSTLKSMVGLKHGSPDAARKSKQRWLLVPGPALLTVHRNNPGMVYTEMSEKDFKPEMYSLIPKVSKAHGTEEVALAFALYFTQDGYLIVTTSYYHGACDCAAMEYILNLLASECRAAQIPGLVPPKDLKPDALPGVLDRSAVMGLAPTTAPDYPAHPSMKVYAKFPLARDFTKMIRESSAADPLGFASVRVTAATTKDLRAKFALEDDPPGFLSDHDIACAILWRGVMAARLKQGRLRKDEVVNFAMPIDIRRFLPKTDPPYLGNALSTIRIELPLPELLGPSGLRQAAVLIRKALQEVSLDTFRAQMSLYVAAPHLIMVQNPSLADRSLRSILVTSWHKFPLHRVNWGPAFGTFEAFNAPYGIGYGGFFTVWPAAGDGSIDTSIALDQRAMKFLDADEDWKQLTSTLDYGPKSRNLTS